jgi:hypothetical protein
LRCNTRFSPPTSTVRPSTRRAARADPRDQIDDLELRGLVGGDRHALAHGLHRPFDVPPALAGDRLAERRGEILDLLPHRPFDVLALPADRMRRSDAGAGAIAATCAAMVMKTPAEPAPAPLGAT